METVNNLASSASRAIWGTSNSATDQNQTSEPVAGETGNVKAGEPYDKGNLDSTETDLASSNTVSGTKRETTFPATTTASENLAATSTSPSTSTDPLKQYQAPWQDNDDKSPSQDLNTTTGASKPVSSAQTAKGGDVQSAGQGLVRDIKDPTAVGSGIGTSTHTGTGTKTGTGVAAATSGSGTSSTKPSTNADANPPSIAKESSRPDTTALPVSASQTQSAKGGESASASGTGAGLQQAGSAGSGKEKVSLKEKIKAKLHKNKE